LQTVGWQRWHVGTGLATSEVRNPGRQQTGRGFLFARTFRELTADFYSRAISYRCGRRVFFTLHRETTSLPPD
jgi:hypothetical protein